jgi:hypothetical protein
MVEIFNANFWLSSIKEFTSKKCFFLSLYTVTFQVYFLELHAGLGSIFQDYRRLSVIVFNFRENITGFHRSKENKSAYTKGIIYSWYGIL